jgi:FAD/FMN-containing dehydrogenase
MLSFIDIGDSCLNVGGLLGITADLDCILDFDRVTGVLYCEGGVSLDSILKVVVPHGWFLPVVPGAKFITVGGAIANDIHGKNHHQRGSFGNPQEA